MGIIRVLDDHIANQIAAGEVVERPSSVVKELVENAIDAGSTRIDVTVEEGGLQLIRIADNGSGIGADDLERAFQRHATSKIATGKDLFRIRTLGFRGEALPSIAAVAKVECVSASDDSGLGRRIVVEGGEVKALEDTSASKGTDIRVKELFFNTPARLKYMKTIQTELGHVSDYMYRLALSHPEIAFTLKHNGSTLLQTLGNGDLLQVIAAIYGTGLAKMMLPIRTENPDYRIGGFISRPEQTRSNRQGISAVINGRYIRNFGLAQALLKAYHTLLPINRYPVAVLHIEMDPVLLDVNVHPSKLEVRFSKEAELLEILERTAKDCLSRQTHIPQGGRSAGAKPAFVQEQLELYRPEPSARQGSLDVFGNRETGPSASASDGPADREAAATKLTEAASGTLYRNGEGEVSGRNNSATDAGRVSSSALPQGTEEPSDWARGADSGPSSDSADPQLFGAAPASPAASEVNPARGYFGEEPSRFAAAAEGEAAFHSAAYREHSTRHSGATGEQPSFPPAYPGSLPSHGSAASRPQPSPASTPSRPLPPGGVRKVLDALDTGASEAAPRLPKFPNLDPIGQLHGTYIVAQNEDGLYLIDQHAAHERIHYETYFDLFGKPREASQELLVPITLEYTPSDAELLKTRLPYLEQVGVYLESFGGGTFLVRAYPHWFPKGEEKDIIDDMTEWVLAEKKSIDLSKLREKASILCSCKASIKANQSLTKVEMEVLLDRLGACRIPYTCPHGRPIVVSFSTYELEKMFKRVM